MFQRDEKKFLARSLKIVFQMRKPKSNRVGKTLNHQL
jgi:hypothetical protein